MSQDKISPFLRTRFETRNTLDVLVIFEKEVTTGSIVKINELVDGINSNHSLREGDVFASDRMQISVVNNLANLSIVKAIT